eukprot:scaffold3297_cov21-Tisochrysis_lutea.AAC.5
MPVGLAGHGCAVLQAAGVDACGRPASGPVRVPAGRGALSAGEDECCVPPVMSLLCSAFGRTF